jgi:hypothetical protein
MKARVEIGEGDTFHADYGRWGNVTCFFEAR